MSKPYTYLIGWTKQNLWYYGSRYSKKCDPSDLWIKYFTSSKVVDHIRKEFGEPDVIKIRRSFDTVDKALKWEHTVITRMKMMSSSKWINLGNAGKEFKITTDQLEKKSKMYTGNGNPNFGKTHTPAARQRISEARKIKGGTHYQSHSDETKATIREKTMNQIASGNMGALIKCCCIVCKQETNLPGLAREKHKHSSRY